MIKLLVIEPEKEPYIKEIEDNLQVYQGLVGGCIESVPLTNSAVLICNEDGIMKKLPKNRKVKHKRIESLDILGTFFIVGYRDDEFVSLHNDDIIKYTLEFSLSGNQN